MATALRNLNEEEENVVEALEQTVFSAISKLEVRILKQQTLNL